MDSSGANSKYSRSPESRAADVRFHRSNGKRCVCVKINNNKIIPVLSRSAYSKDAGVRMY